MSDWPHPRRPSRGLGSPSTDHLAHSFVPAPAPAPGTATQPQPQTHSERLFATQPHEHGHSAPAVPYHALNHPIPAAPVQFPVGYDLGRPGAPSAWAWENAFDFADYTPRYEPQGELIHELHARNTHASPRDFSIPLPIAPIDPQRPSPRNSLHAAMKRKAASEPDPGALAANAPSDENPPKRQSRPRAPSINSSSSESHAPASMTAPKPLSITVPPSQEAQRRTEATTKGTGQQQTHLSDGPTPRRIVESQGPDVLPSGKVFPIQIGSELFRLSGASISSDAPSYFSHFFREQIHSNQNRAADLRTLYIDRDPETFRDIALHLQGYHVSPRNGEHFVRLFADAQFYSLPRLTKQLFSNDIFIRIGGVPFQIPRDIFSSPGDSPNYFSLGFAQFFSTPAEVFPGLDRNALLRPPSISPPSVPNRSGETFGELVKMLQGYPVEIRNDAHRSQLLRDARYFHLRGLEQKLIPCEVSYNLRCRQSEILIRLDDVRQSGISFTADAPATVSASGSGFTAPPQRKVLPASSTNLEASSSSREPQVQAGTVSYARPYTDDHTSTNILILELSSDELTTLHFSGEHQSSSTSPDQLMLDLRATFYGVVLARITSLFSRIASKMGLPANAPLGRTIQTTGGSEHHARVRLDPNCYLEIDNAPAKLALDQATGRIGIRRNRVSDERSLNLDADEWIWGGARASKDGNDLEETVVVRRGHWKIRVEPVAEESSRMMAVLCGVKIEGYTQERTRNERRRFLGA